jgi:hypothetical protein
MADVMIVCLWKMLSFLPSCARKGNDKITNAAVIGNK